ncbi:MAG: ABC transporter ATP-binding protein [Mycobacteriales bacterium]|nr:MAG: ABC transporter ATP-binding protein [Pseudonocardiales bacterium]
MSAPLVQAERLSIRFGPTAVVDDVDLSVARGTELALTGRSGSGKTTVLLALAGLVPPSAGSVCWPGLHSDPKRRAAQIGLVFQAPSLLPELNARENVTLPLRLRGADQVSAISAAQIAMAAVDLADIGDAMPAELSGGQQQRVAVARVLAGEPLLVLADEPTGALDRVTAARVLTVLRDDVRSRGGGLVVATHDDELASLLADRAQLSDRRLTHTVGGSAGAR